jgi:hypothetical protein
MNNNTDPRGNNYSGINYFSKQLTEITIKTSIDLVRLSNIGYYCFTRIDKQLKDNGYKVTKDHALRKGMYSRRRKYEKNTSKIDYLYKHRYQDIHNTNDVIILHSPDTEVMELVDDIFWKTYDTPMVAKIELAFDFYVKGIPALYFKEAIQKYLCLRNQRSKSFNYKTTFYTNNVRKSSKGIRLYPKIIDGKDAVRLELEIHRSKIRDLNIPFPVTDKSLEIDFTKMFCFKKIDTEKFIKAEVKKNRHAIAMADIESNGKDKMLLTMIKSYVDAVDCNSLMEGLEILRSKDHGVDGYGRFLVPMEKETALINEVADRQGFIKEKFSFDLHGGFYRL